jgi:hypothetical protein
MRRVRDLRLRKNMIHPSFAPFACNFSPGKKYYTAKAKGGKETKKRARALFLDLFYSAG